MDPTAAGAGSSRSVSFGAGHSRNLDDAKRILAENGIAISSLPKQVNDERWRSIRTDLKLTAAQTGALKNYVSFLSWTSKSNVDTVMIDENFSQSDSHAKELYNCLLDVPGEISAREAIFGPGNCLLDLLLLQPLLLPEGLREVFPTRDSLIHVLESMISEHSNWIISVGANPGTTAANISFEHKLALRLYTAAEPVPLFKVVNSVLNSQDREIAGLKYIKPFMKLLLLAAEELSVDELQSGRRYVGIGYRGLKVEGNFELQRKLDNMDTVFGTGRLITLAGFTSISTDESIARTFCDKLLFKLVDLRGVHLTSLSVYPTEKEVLVLPPAVFKVLHCNKEGNIVVVVLTHCDQPGASYLGRSLIPPTATPHVNEEVSARVEEVQIVKQRPPVHSTVVEECATSIQTGADSVPLERLTFLWSQVQRGNETAWAELFSAATDLSHPLAQALVGICFMADWISIVVSDAEMARKFGTQAVGWLRKRIKAESEFEISIFERTYLSYLIYLGILECTETINETLDPVLSSRGTNPDSKYNVVLSDAEVLMGLFYFHGRATSGDPAKQAVSLFRSAACKNNVLGQCMLALCYISGKGVTEDKLAGCSFFGLAAQNGFAVAQHSLGVCFERGCGLEEDPLRASELFRQAAEQLYPNAQFSLGVLYAKGKGVEIDQNLAVEWYQAAAKQNYVPAQSALAYCLEHGIGAEKNIKLAKRWNLQACAQRDVGTGNALPSFAEVLSDLEMPANAAAQNKNCDNKVPFFESLEVGEFPKRGSLMKSLEQIPNYQDLKESDAVSELSVLANGGHAAAQYLLGHCYEVGIDVEENTNEAHRLYMLSARQNYAPALCSAGLLLLDSAIEGANDVDGLTLIRQAAEQDDAEGLFWLGQLHEFGVASTPQDMGAAIDYYRRAAALMYTPAITQLGVIRLEDEANLALPAVEAFDMFQRAAAEGDPRAWHYAGVCLCEGLGTGLDELEGLNYIHMAASSFFVPALLYLGRYYLRQEESDEVALGHAISNFANGSPPLISELRTSHQHTGRRVVGNRRNVQRVRMGGGGGGTGQGGGGLNGADNVGGHDGAGHGAGGGGDGAAGGGGGDGGGGGGGGGGDGDGDGGEERCFQRIPLSSVTAAQMIRVLINTGHADFVLLFQRHMSGTLLEQCNTASVLDFRASISAALEPGYGASGGGRLQRRIGAIPNARFRSLKGAVEAWRIMGAPY